MAVSFIMLTENQEETDRYAVGVSQDERRAGQPTMRPSFLRRADGCFSSHKNGLRVVRASPNVHLIETKQKRGKR